MKTMTYAETRARLTAAYTAHRAAPTAQTHAAICALETQHANAAALEYPRTATRRPLGGHTDYEQPETDRQHWNI